MAIEPIEGVREVQAAPAVDTQSIEQKIEQLQKQLKQVRENDSLSQEEKQKRIKNLEEQIARLQEQQMRAQQQQAAQQKAAQQQNVQASGEAGGVAPTRLDTLA